MQKKFTFCSSPSFEAKSWFQLLVAFTPVDRFFKRLYGPHPKRANKRCRAYTSLFSNMNTKFLKQSVMCSCKISIFICKSSVYFSAPSPPFSASAPSLCLHWRWRCGCPVAFGNPSLRQPLSYSNFTSRQILRNYGPFSFGL